MTMFLLALVIFLAAHMVPAMPGIRSRLVHWLGERRYLTVYSILSLALLFWVIAAALQAPYVALWTPPAWSYWVPVVVMPLALPLLTAGLLAPNPLSVTLARGRFDPARAGVVRLTRHPVLWGFGLWGAAHIPPNGALVPVILFGGLTLFAVGGMKILDRKRHRKLGEAEWRRLDAERTDWPVPGALINRRSFLGIALGLILYAFFLHGGHLLLFGVDPLAALG